LRYKIKDIPDEGLLCDQAVPAAILKDALEGLEADPARSAASFRIELTRSHDDVFARGTLTGTLGVSCAACLGPARVDVSAPIDLIFRREAEEAAEEEESKDPLADLEIASHDGKEIDLAPIVREQIILALPISSRCRESCKGLCATCGQNLNERDCGHRAVAGEKPLAALKDLKLE
jgi:uncharacterized protein